MAYKRDARKVLIDLLSDMLVYVDMMQADLRKRLHDLQQEPRRRSNMPTKAVRKTYKIQMTAVGVLSRNFDKQVETWRNQGIHHPTDQDLLQFYHRQRTLVHTGYPNFKEMIDQLETWGRLRRKGKINHVHMARELLENIPTTKFGPKEMQKLADEVGCSAFLVYQVRAQKEANSKRP